MSHPSKRQKLKNGPGPAEVRRQRAAFLTSITRDVSPPASRATPNRFIDVPAHTPAEQDDAVCAAPTSFNDHSNPAVEVGPSTLSSADSPSQANISACQKLVPTLIPSPFRLTKIRNLPKSENTDTVSLHDILGNPLVREAWIFNFCFDIDWMMQHFDLDIRRAVQVRVIHGSWKREDTNRIYIEDACSRWPNVTAATAYLPDPFGTHHSKMFVLFTHDDCAEVIIHTANMLAKDWTNMTQAVWRSGVLPANSQANLKEPGPIGSGSRIKHDLLAYLEAYKKPVRELHTQLSAYDFSSVRGAIVASVPTKLDSKQQTSSKEKHLWGYPQLREVIKHVKKTRESRPITSHLVAQVSSIATLGSEWIDSLISAAGPDSKRTSPSSLSIIYPTALNVASSLDGYAAGGSIHTKAQSAAHLKQIDSLRPYLCQWTAGTSSTFKSGRDRAAPHIKTYIEYNTKPTRQKLEKDEVEIDWALLTSANLSTQAWGSLPRTEKKGKTKIEEGVVHIQSFEIGVLVWPELYLDHSQSAIDEDSSSGEQQQPRVRIVPVFGKDTPETSQHGGDASGTVVGLRMPYDLPLTAYGNDELPWSPQGTYQTPDSKGMTWPPSGW